VPVHRLAEQGFNAARAYERGRPGYAPEAVAAVADELGLDRSSRVLDLAAGTGQLTRAFLPLVGSVVAVEPSADMRGVLAEVVPGIEVLAGEAESLPLPAASVDAVVVGSAFHWFDGDRALPEMARVLRTGGGLGLLWNEPVTWEPRWPEEMLAPIRRHLKASVPEQHRYDSGLWRRAFDDSVLFEPLASGSAQHQQHLDRERTVAQVASWSWVAALPDGERVKMLEHVRAYAPEACVVTFRTDFHTTRPRD
jgi:SAM-dependent methyltransferase